MAEEKAAAAEPKSGKSNLILIIVIAVLTTVLVGGGITAAILLSKDHKTEEHADADAEEEVVAEAESDKKDDKKTKKDDKSKKDKSATPKAPAIYIPLEPPFVVNFDATQSSRFLQVTVEIMTRDPALSQLIKDNNPAIRNDLLLLFGNQDASVISTRDGKEQLRKDVLEAVRNVAKTEGGKPELVENVFFTTFVMQ
jgi:flagellar protein FliL